MMTAVVMMVRLRLREQQKTTEMATQLTLSRENRAMTHRRRRKRILSAKLLLLLALSMAHFLIVLPCGVYGEEQADNLEELAAKTVMDTEDIEESESKKLEKEESGQKKNEVDLSVVVLTSRNFDKSINDGNVWLVEFYAPWCSHCRHFESTYAEIAAYFHGSSQNVRIAKVDGDSERALSSRFGVEGFPSFYLVDGWSVYSFELNRSKNNLIRFIETGYKNQDPIPFYSSPMGPLGLSQGLVMTAGLAAADHFDWLQKSFGLSPLFAGAFMFGVTFLGCFCTIVFLAIVITPKAKVD